MHALARVLTSRIVGDTRRQSNRATSTDSNQFVVVVDIGGSTI
jgi:hypothetical protein